MHATSPRASRSPKHARCLRAVLLLLLVLPLATIQARQRTPFVAQDAAPALIATLTPGSGARGGEAGTSLATSADGTTVAALAPSDRAPSTVSVAYIFVRSGSQWADATHTAQLYPSHSEQGARFGITLAMSADGAVIAIEGQSEIKTSVIYIYVRPATGWVAMTETARLSPSDGAEGARMHAVAISGDGATIVAARDHPQVPNASGVCVFLRPGDGWHDATETAQLSVDDPTYIQESAAVALSADATTIALGVTERFPPGGFPSGAVYVYTRPAMGWTNASQTALLSEPAIYVNRLGSALAMNADGSVLAATMSQNSSGNSGTVYVFTRPTDGWSDTTTAAVLHASDGTAYALLGVALDVSANGAVLIAGAPGQSDTGPFGSGAAYVFSRSASGWLSSTETEKFVRPDAPAQSSLGRAVAVSDDGTTFFVSAPYIVAGEQSGVVYVYGPSTVTQAPSFTSQLIPEPQTTGSVFHTTFTATGSPPPTFRISDGMLPPGLQLDPNTGVLAGVLTMPGTFVFTITARNGTLPDAQQRVTLVVRTNVYLPVIRT